MRCGSCCEDIVSETNYVSCSTCVNRFHRECVTETITATENYVCPECKCRKPKGDNTNTPVRLTTARTLPTLSESSNVTLRGNNKNKAGAGVNSAPTSPKSRANLTKNQIKEKKSSSTGSQKTSCSKSSDFPSDMLTRKEINEIVEAKLEEMKSLLTNTIRIQIITEMKTITEELKQDFTATTDFLTGEINDMKLEITAAHKNINKISMESSAVLSKANELQTRLALAEQNSRECNIELDCVPENRNENVIEVVKKLASVVSYDLPEKDILSCYRVAKMDKKSNRPRAIVAKLPSPRRRDELLAAVRKFNKSSAEKLHSTHLELTNDKAPIYISEHLSPANKSLHAATRKVVKEKKLKFCWVRNGHIFVRKNLTSPSILIRNESTLTTL